MDLEVTGDIWYWRGPSPFHFVTVDDEGAEFLREIMREVTYGWGMIPVQARIGDTPYTTSLFPKNGGYIVPIKDAVRRAEELEDGDVVTISMTVTSSRWR
ncbi:DUF1905 domain-containing protein [Occultella aeris]|uniref:DUF1905 domain-containing protein n=1 Tax=Occultella aeris TaxID=2761496 RepID=A0A7M4DT41_9MICO|nr:DUF1905 domain-containing protein [Occultella aeris]VZO40635.1 hypothetical protein HALOF300_05343 [Occultella aeris]